MLKIQLCKQMNKLHFKIYSNRLVILNNIFQTIDVFGFFYQINAALVNIK